MATFRAGQQTYGGVLLQLRPLESVSADTSGSRHETGHRRHRLVGPGAEHGRGESATVSPGGGGVTPEPPCGAGERPRERRPSQSHPFVFVLDRHGTPLQPCHPARARELLRKGRAVVARHTPFVIRLKDRAVADSEVGGVEVGVDPGSRHTGIAVFTARAGQRRARFALQLNHRSATIRTRMEQRAAYRRRRRSANLRYRAPRFSNRTRPDGWLPPSLRHGVDTTVSWMDRLTRWAPVTAVHAERVAFDTHLLQQADGYAYTTHPETTHGEDR